MSMNLAVTVEPRDQAGDVQHIAAILPQVLAQYPAGETQTMPEVESRPPHIMPSPLRLDSSKSARRSPPGRRAIFNWAGTR